MLGEDEHVISRNRGVEWRGWAEIPPEKDCARTSAVNAVLLKGCCGLSSETWWRWWGWGWWWWGWGWRGWGWWWWWGCSPSTFLHLPYRKLCRTSEVMISHRDRFGDLKPDFILSASAGKTEPMAVCWRGKEKTGDGGTNNKHKRGYSFSAPECSQHQQALIYARPVSNELLMALPPLWACSL